MGVRIQMYAVDLPRFESVLEQSLGEVLRYYADRGASDETLHYVGDGIEDDYCAQPEKGVFLLHRGQKPRQVPNGEQPLVLNRRLRDVLDGGSAYFFANVLRSLARYLRSSSLRRSYRAIDGGGSAVCSTTWRAPVAFLNRMSCGSCR